MAKTTMTVTRTLKSGEQMKYTYDQIGNQDISSYMYKKLKETRRLRRLEKGKVLCDEIPEEVVRELQLQRESGLSYSTLSKKHGLSRYLIQKAISRLDLIDA